MWFSLWRGNEGAQSTSWGPLQALPLVQHWQCPACALGGRNHVAQGSSFKRTISKQTSDLHCTEGHTQRPGKTCCSGAAASWSRGSSLSPLPATCFKWLGKLTIVSCKPQSWARVSPETEEGLPSQQDRQSYNMLVFLSFLFRKWSDKHNLWGWATLFVNQSINQTSHKLVQKKWP